MPVRLKIEAIGVSWAGDQRFPEDCKSVRAFADHGYRGVEVKYLGDLEEGVRNRPSIITGSTYTLS